MQNNNNTQPNIPELNNPPEKLTWTQKIALKRAIKKARKQHKKAIQNIDNDIKKQQEQRQKMQQCILETLEIFTITHQFKNDKKETELNKHNITKLTYEETLEIFEQTITQLQKII